MMKVSDRDRNVSLMWEQAVREDATICPRPLQVDLWPFDLESDVRVTCDVGYLCANFSLPRPLCSRLKPDVRDRQADVRRASSLNAPTIIAAGHNKLFVLWWILNMVQC